MLIVEGGGATNAEALDAYFQAIRPLVAELAGQPWVVLVTIRGDSLMTFDAEARMRQGVHALNATDRSAVGMVLPKSFIVRAQWQRIYKDSGCPFAYFDDESEARVWLSQFLTR